MNKKIKKVLIVIIIFLILISLYAIKSNAVDDGVGTGAINEFMDLADDNHTDDNKSISTVRRVFGAIGAVLQISSISIAVIMLIILAIKYMCSSVQDRAEIKKHAVIYIVGALLIFSVNGIITILVRFSKNVKYSDTDIKIEEYDDE